MKEPIMLSECTADEAIQGVETYRMYVNEKGELTLEEVDTFYLMAQEELGRDTPVQPLPAYWRENSESQRLSQTEMDAEERRAISPARASLHAAGNKVREAYQRANGWLKESDVLDEKRESIEAYSQ